MGATKLGAVVGMRPNNSDKDDVIRIGCITSCEML